MNSHLLSLFIFYRSSGEKLIKYQANSSCVIMFVILMTTLFYKALILQGEIWCWSPLGLKGLKGRDVKKHCDTQIWATVLMVCSFVCLFVCLFVSSMHNIQHVSVYDRKWLCFNHFHPCEPHSYIWSQSFLCCTKPFIFRKTHRLLLSTTVKTKLWS